MWLSGLGVIAAGFGRILKRLLEFIGLMKKSQDTSAPIVNMEKNIITDFRAEFIKALPVIVAEKFDPLIVYTHAAHETGGFKSFAGSYNYFGMKPPFKYLMTHKPPFYGWDGIKVLKTTHEESDKIEKLRDYFCAFGSATKCLIFYKFQIARVYPGAYANRASPQVYFKWLERIGWATDKPDKADPRTYSQKLNELYAHFKANGIAEQLLKLF